MVHVLVVSPVEEAQLLVPVGGIVGRIHIEQDLASAPHLLSAHANESIEQSLLTADDLARRGRILPTSERGLRAQRLSQGLIGKDLEGGVMAQPVGIVDILVAGHDLVDPLAHEREYGMPHALASANIAHVSGEVTGETMTLVECAQGKKTGITADLPTGKVAMHGQLPFGCQSK